MSLTIFGFFRGSGSKLSREELFMKKPSAAAVRMRTSPSKVSTSMNKMSPRSLRLPGGGLKSEGRIRFKQRGYATVGDDNVSLRKGKRKSVELYS